jgi:hypothetical protein
MRDIETERWLDCRRELRLLRLDSNINIFVTIDEISYYAITYLRCFHVNPIAVAEERDACGPA